MGAKESCLTNEPVIAVKRPDGTIKLSEKNLKKYMFRANKFARDLESYCRFPKGENEEDSDDDTFADSSDGGDEENRLPLTKGQNKLKVKKERAVFNTSQRLRGLAEIEQKLAELKGQRVNNIKEARYKKNLKTRFVKQNKKLKRRMEKVEKSKNKKGLKGVKENVGDSSLDGDTRNSLSTEGKGGAGEKVIFNKEDKMVFNKFNFSGIGKNHPKKRKQEKDAKSILNEMKKKQNELTELEKSGESDKAKGIKEKQLWLSALQKAEGVKVKDDPELLKRTIRKEKEGKNRRKRKWENRVETVKKMKDDRQKKRQENIDAKKLMKKKKKIKKSVKKGRVVL